MTKEQATSKPLQGSHSAIGPIRGRTFPLASVDRRVFIAGLTASIAAASSSIRPAHGQGGEDSYYSDDFLTTLFESNSEDVKPPQPPDRPALYKPYKVVLAEIDQAGVGFGWAEDAQSPDFFHQREGHSRDSFPFTASDLTGLLKANGFALPGGNFAAPHLLFGLRGCTVAGAEKASGPVVELVEAVPDHLSSKCVIGVWKVGSDVLDVFNASTVPDVAYIYAQAIGMDGANMMPTGCYDYVVGTHGQTRPKVAQQPGVWRQAMAWPVRRITAIPQNKALVYTHDAVWDTPRACETRRSTGNNIHAGVLYLSSLKTKFSSAGCQTIPGRYEPKGELPTGPVADFREAAGLAAKPDQTQNGMKYRYALLTGREARLASRGASALNGFKRLRYGSRGTSVRLLQKSLNAKGFKCVGDDSMFGMQTAAALVRFQQQSGLSPDGIVTPEVAAKLGIGL